MANVKEAIFKKKIGDIVYDLMVKTTAAMVYVDDTTTLESSLSTMSAAIKDSTDKLAELLGEDNAKSITGQIETAVTTAINAIKNEEDPESLAGKIKALKDVTDAINNETTGVLATAKGYTDQKLGLSDTAYSTVKEYVEAIKTELNNTISGAFHFKGSVDYVADLPAENVSEGDVYQVKYAGTEGTVALNAEYAYNGTEFVELGSILDLSSYSTTEQVTSAISTAKSEAISTAAADAKTKADAAQAAAEATAANALNAYKTSNDAAVAARARFIVSETQPDDLTEADLWAQIVTA